MDILLYCSDTAAEQGLRSMLPESAAIRSAWSESSFVDTLAQSEIDLAIVDVSLLLEQSPPSSASMERRFAELAEQFPNTLFLALCAKEHIRMALAAVRGGAVSILCEPLESAELSIVLQTVRRRAKLNNELRYLREYAQYTPPAIETQCAEMRQVYEQLRAVAKRDTPVLLIGEAGTGKKQLAVQLHRWSGRHARAFVSLECSTYSEAEIERQLFGSGKAALSGTCRSNSRLRVADGGSLFFDEIGAVSPSLQIRLMALVGSAEAASANLEGINVRVIASTNVDLLQMVEDGTFREDLYDRLNVFPVFVPPLRKRWQDIGGLCQLLLNELNSIYLKGVESIDPAALQALQAYPWPGNIRELRNVLERAYILEKGQIITPESFPPELYAFPDQLQQRELFGTVSLAEARHRGLQALESQYLKELLIRNKGKINQSAKQAGVSSRQLHKLMRKYSLRKEIFKSSR